MKAPQGSRLDSWKEIAEHLGRNVRTVTRWAHDRGLPVHRVPGGSRGHVFAYVSEIEDWLLNQKVGPAAALHSAAPPPQAMGKSEYMPASKSVKAAVSGYRRFLFSLVSPRWQTAVVASVLLAVGVSVSLALRPASSSASQVFAIRYDVDTLLATNADGRTLWTYHYPNSKFSGPFATHPRKNIPVRIADFFHDGNKEAAVVVPLESGTNPNQIGHSELDFFSSQGNLIWKYLPERTFQFGTNLLSGPWFFMDLLVSQSDSMTTLWATAGHHTWGDSFVTKIDPHNGRATLRFVNTGVIYQLNELKTSSGTFLLAGGFNNEWDGGSLAIINEDRPFAASPQSPGTRHFCNSCPPGAPDYYFVFPRTEINRISGVYEDPVFDIQIVDEGIQVRKFERFGRGGENTIYVLSAQPPFKVLSFLYDSDYDSLHKKWSAEGKISHSLKDCPERLHPLPVRLWTASNGWTEIPVGSVKIER